MFFLRLSVRVFDAHNMQYSKTDRDCCTAAGMIEINVSYTQSLFYHRKRDVSVSRNIMNYRANFAFIVFDYIKSSQYSKRCYILFVSKLRFKLDYVSLQSVFHLYHKEPQVLDSVLKYCELIGQK